MELKAALLTINDKVTLQNDLDEISELSNESRSITTSFRSSHLSVATE